ncbi:hypothetical protein INR49_027276 [Caranx melampygus]|nr:hypothetical protein INR49_027276 [Caranx melampygus]
MTSDLCCFSSGLSSASQRKTHWSFSTRKVPHHSNVFPSQLSVFLKSASAGLKVPARSQFSRDKDQRTILIWKLAPALAPCSSHATPRVFVKRPYSNNNCLQPGQ